MTPRVIIFPRGYACCNPYQTMEILHLWLMYQAMSGKKKKPGSMNMKRCVNITQHSTSITTTRGSTNYRGGY